MDGKGEGEGEGEARRNSADSRLTAWREGRGGASCVNRSPICCSEAKGHGILRKAMFDRSLAAGACRLNLTPASQAARHISALLKTSLENDMRLLFAVIAAPSAFR